jgi:hypothetical protein
MLLTNRSARAFSSSIIFARARELELGGRTKGYRAMTARAPLEPLGH